MRAVVFNCWSISIRGNFISRRNTDKKCLCGTHLCSKPLFCPFALPPQVRSSSLLWLDGRAKKGQKRGKKGACCTSRCRTNNFFIPCSVYFWNFLYHDRGTKFYPAHFSFLHSIHTGQKKQKTMSGSLAARWKYPLDGTMVRTVRSGLKLQNLATSWVLAGIFPKKEWSDRCKERRESKIILELISNNFPMVSLEVWR